MKKIRVSLCILGVMMTFSGCGGRIPDMTEEEQEAISEYAAGLLLKYNTDQDSRLVDLELLEEQEEAEMPETTPEPTEAPETVPEATPEPSTIPEVTPELPESGGTSSVEYANLQETLLLSEDVDLVYVDYETVSSYSDAEQSLDAAEGYCFLVVKCKLTNTGTDKQVVDMMQTNVKHTVIVNGTSINAMVTMLSNDMTTYMGELAAGEEKEIILLAEVEDKLMQEAENIVVEFTRDELVSGIIVK